MTQAVTPVRSRRPRRPTRGDDLSHARRLHLGSRPTSMGAAVLAAVLALAWATPLLWGLLTSLKSEDDATAVPLRVLPAHGFTLESYRAVIQNGNVPTWMLNSVIVSVIVTAITVLVSAMIAYALSRLEFPGRKALLMIVIGSIMIPPQILIAPLFREMVNLHLVDTLAGVILPQTVAPMMVFVLVRFFDGIPVELEEAALIDGAGRWRIFWTMILPLSRPILVAVSIFVFIGAWNNFLWPFIVTNDPSLMTLPVGLGTVKDAYGVQYSQTLAGAMLAALPLIAIFLVFQRQVVRGIATTGLGGQ